jgi:hypothetical protein
LLFATIATVRVLRLTVLTCLLAAATMPAARDVTGASQAYTDALNAGLFAEAEVIAKQRLETAIRDPDTERFDLVPLYTDLASAQRLHDQVESARQNYQLAIDIAQSERDRLHPAVVPPLVGLALTQMAQQEPRAAADNLQRALHIGHVNKGPHNPEQIETLALYFDAVYQAGDTGAAESVAARLLVLNERQLESNSSAYVSTSDSIAGMYALLGDRRQERSVYAEMLANAERIGDASLSAAAETTARIGMGRSYLIEYFDQKYSAGVDGVVPEATAIRRSKSFLTEALENARQMQPADPDVLSDALLALGDYNTLMGNAGLARNLYAEAWRTLSENPGLLQKRKTVLEQVTPLLQPLPRISLPDSEPGAGSPGYYETMFTVTRRGRVRDVSFVEVEPAPVPAIEEMLVEAYAYFVYRPRFENGFVADTTGVRFRYEFVAPDPG